MTSAPLNNRSIVMKQLCSISFDCTAHELQSKITKVTTIQKRFKYVIWIDSQKYATSNSFYGVINENCFEIVNIIPGRNYFTPVFYGVFQEKDSNTIIKITAKQSPLISLSYVCLTLMLLSYLIIYQTTQNYLCLFFSGFSIIFTLVLALLNHHFIKKNTVLLNRSLSKLRNL